MSGPAARLPAAVFSGSSLPRPGAALPAPLLLGVLLLMVKRQLLVAASRGYTTLRPPGSRLDDFPDLLFVAHVAAFFDCSTATVSRRVHDGTFPVPPLPAIDRKLRWSRAQLRAWLETGDLFAHDRVAARRAGRRV